MKLIELTETRYAKLMADKARLDWLERKHGESNGARYEVECSITYDGNSGAPPLFPATRAGIDKAMIEIG